MIDRSATIRRGDDVVFRELQGEGAVALRLETGQYHGLNDVGRVIFELTETPTTFGEIVAGVRARVDDPPEGLEDDVSRFLEQLAERDLVEIRAPGQPA